MEGLGVTGVRSAIGVSFFCGRRSTSPPRKVQDNHDNEEREDTWGTIVRRDKARAHEEDLDKAGDQS